MENLPSYEEAMSGPDWLSLAAPFVPLSSWRQCCLVNRRFYREFAPRLWQDPLVTVRKLGLDPNDDLIWYRRFINKHVKSIRLETRLLVRSLDFRDFALRASGLYSTEASERAISESFRYLPEIFPRLTCLLIDGHPELDPSSLARTNSDARAPTSLQLLDIARCPQELTPKLFNSAYFRELVYLDMSHIPGSVKSAVLSSLNSRFLPELRVLKVQGREMDDTTARLLFKAFSRQLWSLNLSENKLTDGIIDDDFLTGCFSSPPSRTDAHFEKEGKLVLPRDVVPTLIAEGLPVPTARRLAESAFYRNIRRAYPQAFTPDMNPRLSSLTLTNIPSRSIGPVIEQLVLFLKLMSTQQKAIRDARAVFSGHRQPLLNGLRYLRFEMEAEFSDDLSTLSSGGEVDFDALLDPGNESFSDETLNFFEEESGGVTSRKRSGLPVYGRSNSQFNKPELYADFASGHRLKTWPYSSYDAEYISLHEPNLTTSSPVEVWIGTGRIGLHAAVNEYMWNLQDPNLRINIGPATPDHVAAGVPPFSYIFYGAWDAIVFPKDLQSALRASMSLPFCDVATAIKEYRLGTKGTSEHWEGKIELVRTSSV
ncbi:hypothetical protein DL768_008513 [Monosporascus sp. mg162]|nr:hypothetical protein DL768_008513 [Monosporascus sp. mg162]